LYHQLKTNTFNKELAKNQEPNRLEVEESKDYVYRDFKGRMKITNYDVLIDASEDDSFRLLNDQHVGNRRFEVVLNIHREEYQNGSLNQDNDEMERIVGKIVDIVCHKCVPNGRFLEKVDFGVSEGEEDDFFDLGEGQLARMRLHQALGGKAPTLEAYSNQRDETVADSSASKRRRRGSYARLRRSISESMLFHSSIQEEDALKAVLDDDDDDSEAPVIIPHLMDIIFTESKKSLATTGMPGNNRFQISLNMESQRFVNSSPDERREILEELQTTVQTHWQGRFLASTDESYEELSPKVVSNAISHLLLQGDGSFNRDASALLSIPESAPVSTPVSAPAPVPIELYCPEPETTPVTSLAPVSTKSSSIMGSSRRQLTPPISFVSDVERHRNAAVEALKAKKAKRDIMNRLGH